MYNRAWIFLVLLLFNSVKANEIKPTPVNDNIVNAVAKEIYCPVCDNIPLDVCDTQACVQWREVIREKLSLGWSPDEIKNYFSEQYGGQVLSEPPIHNGVSFNLLIYLIPGIVLLAGFILVIKSIHSGMRRG